MKKIEVMFTRLALIKKLKCFFFCSIVQEIDKLLFLKSSHHNNGQKIKGIP